MQLYMCYFYSGVDEHPIPKAEDLLTTLAGGKCFSKLDLSQAYQQMLDTDDRKYTTINLLTAKYAKRGACMAMVLSFLAFEPRYCATY